MSVSLMRRLRGGVQEHMPLMITCRQFEDFMADYCDRKLRWYQRLIFRTHLVFCRECRDYLAAYVRAIALGKAVFHRPDVSLPEAIPEELVRAILAARPLDND